VEGFRAAWITGLSRCLNTLFKWALAMPALPRRRERWLAVAIGLAANFLWGRAASAIIGGLASFAGGIALAFLLIPLIATLPPVLFLLVPAAAQRLAAWRGGG